MDFLHSPIPHFVSAPKLFIVLLMIVSGAVGSFFTMYYYRLPMMLKAWKKGKKAKINLCFPASHCPACKVKLKFWQNFPLIGYLIQRGQCVFCKTKIPIRYFLIESGFVIFGLFVVLLFKITYLTLVMVFGIWVLLALLLLVFLSLSCCGADEVSA